MNEQGNNKLIYISNLLAYVSAVLKKTCLAAILLLSLQAWPQSMHYASALYVCGVLSLKTIKKTMTKNQPDTGKIVYLFLKYLVI